MSASVSCKSCHGNGDTGESALRLPPPSREERKCGVEGLLGLRCRISQISIIVIGISDIKNPFGLDLVLFVATCKVVAYIGDNCGVYQLGLLGLVMISVEQQFLHGTEYFVPVFSFS